MKQIAILCHWSSGSSILAKTLRDCGMQIGNEKTWWTAECEEQCEHGLLNTVGNLLYHGRRSS